jgi:tryptophan 2,3-dioxygenase
VAKDYSVAVLVGDGDSDYARYMRTDTLLSLQRDPQEMVHRDELLFQTVHQSTELWLKLAASDVAEAGRLMHNGEFDAATRLFGRGSRCLQSVTEQLDIMRFLSPWDFQTIRTVLGHGSGFESPGWESVRNISKSLNVVFNDLIKRESINLVELYQYGQGTALYRLAEAIIDWDERISIWRVSHYKMATRILGYQVIGTKGIPIDVLTRLINHRFFPELWRIRTELTAVGPMGIGTEAL